MNIRSLNFKFKKKNLNLGGVRIFISNRYTRFVEGARQYKWENRDCLYSMIYLNSCGKNIHIVSNSKTSQKYVEVKICVTNSNFSGECG